MATSVIYYIFREFAISYLGRNDLAHAELADLLPDSVGKGSDEGTMSKQESNATFAAVQLVASKGYVRNRLSVLPGGQSSVSGLQTNGSLALKGDIHDQPDDVINAYELSAQAKLKGYAGDACGDCGNFTLVRNGTCLKCVTCGSTSGCS